MMNQHPNKMQSFVDGSLNSPFSIYNLPYGVFREKDSTHSRIGTAIGQYVLDLALLEEEGLFKNETNESYFNNDTLNVFASMGPKVWSVVRKRIQTLLSSTHHELQNNSLLLNKALIPMHDVVMQLPFKVEGFSDFYASEQHATNVGRLFRGNDNALLPNWKYIPVAYNGRASTVFPSGTEIKRPKGLMTLPNHPEPVFSPSKKLDFELELGVFVGVGNHGNPIVIEDARAHIFGLVLLNDWSARDIQAFEYQPLGPFLSKSFATSISNWVVPFEALEPTLVPIPKQIPQAARYFYQETPMLPDIELMVELQPRGSNTRTLICETNCKELYWSMEQMLSHHTVNNCIMKPGDLLGTGTISGIEKTSWGSLLELSFNGKEAITLNDGTKRTFLEDGDSVLITGYAHIGKHKIGFGTLEGTISPAT